MQSLRKDMWIGVFVLAAVFLLLAAFGLYKGLNPYSRKIYMSLDRVSSIKKGDKVQFKGFDIGLVNDIAFYPAEGDDKDRFEVELLLKKDFKLYKGTELHIKAAGLMGASFVDVVLPDERTALLEGRVELSGSDGSAGIDMGGLFENLNKATASVFEADLEGKLGAMVTQFDKFGALADQLAGSMQKTIGKVDKTIDKSGGQLDSVMVKVGGNLDSLNSVLINIKGLMGDEDAGVRKIVNDLDATVEKARGLMDDIDTVANKHKGDVSEMIVNLKDAAISMNYLSKNPRKFLFGGKVRGLGDVEKEKAEAEAAEGATE